MSHVTEYVLTEEQIRLRDEFQTKSLRDLLGLPNTGPLDPDMCDKTNGFATTSGDITLIDMLCGNLSTEQKLTLLQAQYEIALAAWETQLKRANKLEAENRKLYKDLNTAYYANEDLTEKIYSFKTAFKEMFGEEKDSP